MRLRVLFVTGWYPTADDPSSGVFVRELAHAVALRHDVTVLHCVGPHPPDDGQWRLEKEEDSSLSEGLPTWRVSWRRTAVPGLSYPFYLYSILRSFRRICDAGFVPDVVHAHTYEPGLPAVLLGRLYRIPVVITEHFSAFAQNELSARELAKARWAFARAARVLPVSAALQHALEKNGVRAHFQIVPNTVDTALFTPWPAADTREDGKRLLFVGRLVDIKGVAELIRAAARLPISHGSWQLDVVGDGPLRLTCERLTLDLGIADRVTFHGTRSKAEIAELMRRADALVLPSRWENLPCVLIEAMASGLPVVATRVGGIPEIVDERSGILVPPGDEVALTSALGQMLDSLGNYDARTLANRAERYGRENVGDVCHDIYADCLRS